MAANIGDSVVHEKYGRGVIDSINAQGMVFVCFDGDPENIKRLDPSSLKILPRIEHQLNDKIDSDSNQKAIAHIQSAVIRYVNNTWGLFSRSTIDLLPHQLWVCKQILENWPRSYLIADDVGLGKTIEAGLIMSSLVASKRVNRILILTPAKLVEQWQERLGKMFNLFFSQYNRNDPHYFETTNRVVASFPTMQNKNHKDLIVKAPSWDLVIVDEAHHMNAEENGAKTLQFKFFEELLDGGKIHSALLFTGTPHRGKDYGFWSLMSLLNPEKFNPKNDAEEQYDALKDCFIRNNKKNVVNMNGDKLFTEMFQHPYEFTYSEEEKNFYDEMTAFIERGYMYANANPNQRTAIGLLLCSLQKIASSSVAAIKSALLNRKKFLEGKMQDMNKVLKEMQEDEIDEENGNYLNDIINRPLKIMEDEEKNIDILLNKANEVKTETRISKIIEIIKNDYPDEQVLLFTEYKRTQALMMSELMKNWGADCVTIINGDENLSDVLYPDGSLRNFEVKRTDACNEFNAKKKRFLISTEAAGEGIDLQKNCHVLIHIDLPWNPMRLHQRVGRVYRLGQTKNVDIISVRNPDNIESKIWDYLNEKIDNIQRMLSAGMDNPDDMKPIVLGMQSSQFYTSIMSQRTFEQAKNTVDSWFNQTTKEFGGHSAMDTARMLGLRASQFNLKGLKDIPKLDLENLVGFMKIVLEFKGHPLLYDKENDVYKFVVPREWRDFGNIGTLNNLIFRRELKSGEDSRKIMGVGEKNIDKALEDANLYKESVIRYNGKESYFVYSVIESSSEDNSVNTQQLFVIKYDSSVQEVSIEPVDSFYLMLDTLKKNPEDTLNYLSQIPAEVQEMVKKQCESLMFKHPEIQLIGVVSGLA